MFLIQAERKRSVVVGSVPGRCMCLQKCEAWLEVNGRSAVIPLDAVGVTFVLCHDLFFVVRIRRGFGESNSVCPNDLLCGGATAWNCISVCTILCKKLSLSTEPLHFEVGKFNSKVATEIGFLPFSDPW